ncbi:MAG: class I SAM-dependent methyltransferase [Planctomycetota bacterium]|jgi:2-polyprenyl-3-methyl-5-hydroxy-6-metoxy-1,4-benzoquinol methylase
MPNTQFTVKQELEYIPCYLCGKDTHETIITSHSRNTSISHSSETADKNRNDVFSLVKCKNCGLQYINPRPTKQQIGHYYSEDYYAHNPLKKKKLKKRNYFVEKWMDSRRNIRNLIRINFYNYPHNREEDKKSLRSYKKILLLFFYLTYRSRLDVIPFTGGGKILDIGCGNGRYLSSLKKQGWQTYGIEQNPKSSKYARDELHLTVKTGDLLDCEYQDKFFDVITMWHSLEHLYEPIPTLKKVKRILKDDGLLVIAVPNIGSFDAKVFKEYWYQLELPIHLIAFTPDSITKMLDSAEFKIKKIYYDRRNATLKRSLLNIKDGKYRLLSKLSRFKTLIKMFNFILAMFRSCDIIVVHAQKRSKI